MALDHYKGGSNPKEDFAVQDEGFRLGRIKGDWEDKLHSATPGHSERNWNHGAQMTEGLGTTDGNIDSQQEVDAVAKWLSENSPGGDATPEAPVEEEPYDPPSKALGHARAYVAAKDETDLQGDTTQMKFGYNPVSGEEGYQTGDGQAIASRFMNRYKDNLTEQMTGKKPDNVSSQLAGAAKVGNAPLSEQDPNTLGMP